MDFDDPQNAIPLALRDLTALAVPEQLLQNRVLRTGNLKMHLRLAWNCKVLPPCHLLPRQRCLGEDKEIDLDHGLQMDEIEGSAATDGCLDALGRDIERPFDSANERLDVVRLQGRDQICILRGPGDAM